MTMDREKYLIAYIDKVKKQIPEPNRTYILDFLSCAKAIRLKQRKKGGADTPLVQDISGQPERLQKVAREGCDVRNKHVPGVKGVLQSTGERR